jgi:D-3-phosphoglycerate dehydrogenase
VNLPSVSADALERAKPYTELAEKLGKLIGQLSVDMNGVGTPIEAVEVKFEGDFTGIPTGAVTRAALVGLLTPVLSDPVNLVNAPGLAKSRGIQVTESQSDRAPEYWATISVNAKNSERMRSASGAVRASGESRILNIDSFRVDVLPEGRIVLTEHTDQPGMIGAVGTLLGDNGVNIAGMQLGRDKEGGLALMALMVDDDVTESVLGKMRALPGMEAARLVTL